MWNLSILPKESILLKQTHKCSTQEEVRYRCLHFSELAVHFIDLKKSAPTWTATCLPCCVFQTPNSSSSLHNFKSINQLRKIYLQNDVNTTSFVSKGKNVLCLHELVLRKLRERMKACDQCQKKTRILIHSLLDLE